MRIAKIIIFLSFVLQSSQINLCLLTNTVQKSDCGNYSEKVQLKYDYQDSFEHRFEKEIQTTPLKISKLLLKQTNQIKINNKANKFELHDIILLLSVIIFYFYQWIFAIFYNLFLIYITPFFAEKIQPPWMEKFLLKI